MTKIFRLGFFVCVILSFVCVLLCGCSSNEKTKEESLKNYATNLEVKDVNLVVGQSQKLDITVETLTAKEYDLGFEFSSEEQQVFSLDKDVVCAKNVGTASLVVKVICGFDERFCENLFLEKTILVCVTEEKINFTLNTPNVAVGTTKDFENFENVSKENLIDLEKEGKKFVLYHVLDEKKQKIEALNKNFFFYAIIMFDNLPSDWYNLTITCNSNAFSVQKISNFVWGVFTKDFGTGTVSVCVGNTTLKNFEFVSKECTVNSVVFKSESSFLIATNEVLDLSPTKVLPAFAVASPVLTISPQNDFLEVVGTKIKAKKEGSCYVTVSVQNFSNTFLVCVSNSGKNILSVPQTTFNVAIGQTVEIKFLLFAQNLKNAKMSVLGDVQDASFDFMQNSVLMTSKLAKRFEFEIVLKSSSNKILAKSGKIVVVFE